MSHTCLIHAAFKIMDVWAQTEIMGEHDTFFGQVESHDSFFITVVPS